MAPSDQPPYDPSAAGASPPGAASSEPVRASLVRPATSPRPPRRIILEQPLGTFRKVLFGLLLLALAISVMFNFGLLGAYHSYVQMDASITEKLHSGSAAARNKIAVIAVKGAIMNAEDGFVKKQIDRALKDKQVKAVVLRIDSPGGTVTASHYLYHHLKKLRKEKEIPLVVSMGSIATSGGYYLSMAVGDTEDAIFAEETTWTGSVGVIIPSYDLSDLLAHWKIRDRSFTSGDLKQMGSPTRELDEQHRKREEAKLQQLVDESFEGFKEVVAYGRPKLVQDDEAMREVVTGQIFTAKQAYKLGLVDQLGYIEDAVRRAAELAKLDPEKVRVVKYEKPPSLLNVALGGSSQAAAASLDLSAMLDLTAPRAYYLSTWVPAIVANRAALK
ncbi:MAG: signal peptide peptidase SppA [Planctomycetota bacterium]|nr:signal peptide peptidase SppA [Planctomycetota bacterium]